MPTWVTGLQRYPEIPKPPETTSPMYFNVTESTTMSEWSDNDSSSNPSHHPTPTLPFICVCSFVTSFVNDFRRPQ